MIFQNIKEALKNNVVNENKIYRKWNNFIYSYKKKI